MDEIKFLLKIHLFINWIRKNTNFHNNSQSTNTNYNDQTK